MRKLLLLISMMVAVSLTARAADAELIKRGQKVYKLHCARCHGDAGYGDGTDAKRLPVPPRNLVQEEYKFKSTEYGTPPSDDDLMWVLDHGMAGAGMPSFSNLSDPIKKDLIAYIKSISNQWGTYEPEPIEAPNVRLKGDLVKGKEMWETLQCALCHGSGGRANGTSAAGLAVRPADLTQPWTYRAGSDPEQVYYRLMAGIAGSGMPSYKDAGFPKEDLWHLAKYVESLQHHPEWKIGIEPLLIDGDLPSGVDDDAWTSAPRSDINMQSQYYEGGKRVFTTVNALTVQMLANDSEWAMKLSWNDPTETTGGGDVDSLAIAFKPETLKDDVRDNLYSLYPYGADPLSFIKWSADRPEEATAGNDALRDVARHTWRGAGKAPASAVYDDGRWTIVVKGPMNDRLKKALAHDTRPALVGFAAWDGGAGESWLKHSATQWRAIPMEKGHAHN